MTKKNRKYSLILIFIGVLIVTYTIFQISNHKSVNALLKIDSLYDYSTKEKLIGASDYVFVGKVNKILRTEHIKELDSNNKIKYFPQTIYSISVIKNIKRKLILDNNIEVNLFGGWNQKHQTLYLTEGMQLFNDNEYYIFFVYLKENNGPLLISDKAQVLKLGKKYNKNDQLIKEVEQAYKKEDVPDKANYMIPKELYISKFDQSIK